MHAPALASRIARILSCTGWLSRCEALQANAYFSNMLPGAPLEDFTTKVVINRSRGLLRKVS